MVVRQANSLTQYRSGKQMLGLTPTSNQHRSSCEPCGFIAACAISDEPESN